MRNMPSVGSIAIFDEANLANSEHENRQLQQSHSALLGIDDNYADNNL